MTSSNLRLALVHSCVIKLGQKLLGNLRRKESYHLIQYLGVHI